MKIKNFIAANMNEAMFLVRQELGPEAIILSNQTVSGEIHLTAALEDRVDFDFTADDSITKVATADFFDDSLLRECLTYHNVAEKVQQDLLSTCRQISHNRNLKDDRQILTAGLNSLFKYVPLFDQKHTVKMFMGTPGSGKSTAIAKVATQAKIKKINTVIISTDNVRAGANKQLEAFAKILELDFIFHKDAKSLFKFLQNEAGNYGLILIDTPGINPFVPAEVDKVAAISEVAKGEKILTLDAGRLVEEAVESAEIFSRLGARVLLPTRLDLTRRIGGVLTVAACCDYAFSTASVNASIANGLAPVTAQSLARLILA